LLSCLDHLRFDNWYFGYSQALVALDTFLKCCLVDLLVLGWIFTALSVDVVRKHFVAVLHASVYGLGILSPVRMKRWLPKIRREG
jgi:hypothetical protein